MNAKEATHNLARTLRPTTFDQIIGQELVLRMLKNALYLQRLFPVYLFAGQRGCGKTSTARVFATAINCQTIHTWRSEPATHSLPCLSCYSCSSMRQGRHPDFIEIDAASHTGVDDVRNLLESAAYLPLMGNIKIYLIDEAHMLSKSAFNAFLKILEEPPAGVIFILATTEAHKIPDTVRSRCFQALFDPINPGILVTYLRSVCTQENISIEEDALHLLVHETEGSARDALNLLEKVRFTYTHATRANVLEVLGKVSEETLLELITHLINQHPDQLLKHLADISFESLNPLRLWYMIIDTLRLLIRTKLQVSLKDTSAFFSNKALLENMANQCSITRLQAMMQLFWEQEKIFLNTPAKHAFLESVLLMICHQVALSDLQTLLHSSSSAEASYVTTHQNAPFQSVGGKAPSSPQALESRPHHTSQGKSTNRFEDKSEMLSPKPLPEAPLPTSSSAESPWQKFLNSLNQLNDNMLTSLFQQMIFCSHDQAKQEIRVQLSQASLFFADKIEESKPLWLPLLHTYYQGTTLIIEKSTASPVTNQQRKPIASSSQPPSKAQSRFVDVSNTEQWPTANLLAKHFSAKIERDK